MSVTAIDIIGKERCTGCFGCANACKFDAIEMKLSEDGFYFPKVDSNKCINCGLCQKKCPVLNFNSSNFNGDDIQTFAAFSTNDDVRFISSSGGVFTEIAEELISEGGIVYGACWTKGLSVKHTYAASKHELSGMRSSKYIQSNLNTVYRDIDKLIAEGKKVLFTGTPCQVAAIKMITNSERLFTLDVVCHGVPSKLVFDEYIKYISKGKRTVSFNFRDKSSGWSKYKSKACFEDGGVYECVTRNDPFFHGFICDLYSNLACYNCKFCAVPRCGDITLGDFWKVPQELMDERGVSVVLANNMRGLELLTKISDKQRIKLYKRGLNEAIHGNPRIHDGFLNMRNKRGEILKTIKRNGFEYINEKYIRSTDRYAPDNKI
jgi:coenzyme F420-reducing hydrogenase beta subunit